MQTLLVSEAPLSLHDARVVPCRAGLKPNTPSSNATVKSQIAVLLGT